MPHEAIVQAVAERAGAMLAFLESVVNMDSPTEDKALADKVGDAFQAKAESLGLVATRDVQAGFADNRICRLAKGRGPRVLMIGHFDTVYEAGTCARRAESMPQRSSWSPKPPFATPRRCRCRSNPMRRSCRSRPRPAAN